MDNLRTLVAAAAILALPVAFVAWAAVKRGRRFKTGLLLAGPVVAFGTGLLRNDFARSADARLYLAGQDMLANPITFAAPFFVTVVYLAVSVMRRVAAFQRPPTAARTDKATNSIAKQVRVPSEPLSDAPQYPTGWGQNQGSDLESKKRCYGCNRHMPAWMAMCPHCSYEFRPSSGQHGEIATGSLNQTAWSPLSPLAAVSPQSPAVTDTPPDPKIVQYIRMLSELRDQGLLTDEEFQSKKAELLRRI